MGPITPRHLLAVLGIALIGALLGFAAVIGVTIVEVTRPDAQDPGFARLTLADHGAPVATSPSGSPGAF